MKITDKKTIQEVQNEFNKKFPFLKIEFYKKAHGEHEGSPDDLKWDTDLTIGEIRNRTNSGDLSIDGALTVGALENNFSEQYGLNVQVFHKSGNLWLQTTATDEWTLDKQNNKAKDFAEFQASK